MYPEHSVMQGRITQQTPTRTDRATTGESAGAIAVTPVPPDAGGEAAIHIPVIEAKSLAAASKRAFDIVFSFLAIVVLAPLMLLIALLVKLDSPGPVLFRSARIGRNGERFGMLKFRTMVDGADEQRAALRHMSEAPDGLFKMQHDPRLTRFGRLLRSVSLDELPQLFQVVTGTMSLVGPRPLPPEEDGLIKGAGRRLKARPGITGSWQLAGSWRVPLTDMVRLDDEYLAGWSIWLDVKMLVRTAGHIFRRIGV
jgi:lipopolysaccharide/colanic/teichoic acid biosynthesis glycosyltransferase